MLSSICCQFGSNKLIKIINKLGWKVGEGKGGGRGVERKGHGKQALEQRKKQNGKSPAGSSTGWVLRKKGA